MTSKQIKEFQEIVKKVKETAGVSKIDLSNLQASETFQAILNAEKSRGLAVAIIKDFKSGGITPEHSALKKAIKALEKGEIEPEPEVSSEVLIAEMAKQIIEDIKATGTKKSIKPKRLIALVKANLNQDDFKEEHPDNTFDDENLIVSIVQKVLLINEKDFEARCKDLCEKHVLVLAARIGKSGMFLSATGDASDYHPMSAENIKQQLFNKIYSIAEIYGLFSTDTEEEMPSDIKAKIVSDTFTNIINKHAHSENRIVSNIGTFCGFKKGRQIIGGKPVMVSSEATFPKAKKGKWDWTEQWLRGLMRYEETPLQYYLLMTWIKRGHIALRDYDHHTLSHILTLVGGHNAGKSSLIECVIKPLFGGRLSNAWKGLTTRFNDAFCNAELLVADDDSQKLVAQNKTILGTMAKKIATASSMDIERKCQDVVMLEPFIARLVIALNPEVSSLSGIPIVDKGLEDKILIFKTADHPPPDFPDDIPEGKNYRLARLVKAELPAFLHWLLNEMETERTATLKKADINPQRWFPAVKDRQSQGCERFGFKHFQNPDIINQINQLSKWYQLIELIAEHPAEFLKRQGGGIRTLDEGGFTITATLTGLKELLYECLGNTQKDELDGLIGQGGKNLSYVLRAMKAESNGLAMNIPRKSSRHSSFWRIKIN